MSPGGYDHEDVDEARRKGYLDGVGCGMAIMLAVAIAVLAFLWAVDHIHIVVN